MTRARELASRTLARLIDTLRLQERGGPDGIPYLRLTSSSAQPVGTVRVFQGAGLDQVVLINLTVPALAIESHMIFAFSAKDSALPHFTLDAVAVGDGFAFHLDLVPRVDLAAHRDMVDLVFQPLTAAYESGRAVAGLTAAQLSPRQRALMSPWMLAFRATAEAFAHIDATVEAYLEHWLQLAQKGLPAAALLDVDVAQLGPRDGQLRASLFDPEIDPVWNQVTRLVGNQTSAALRDFLREPAAAAAMPSPG